MLRILSMHMFHSFISFLYSPIFIHSMFPYIHRIQCKCIQKRKLYGNCRENPFIREYANSYTYYYCIMLRIYENNFQCFGYFSAVSQDVGYIAYTTHYTKLPIWCVLTTEYIFLLEKKQGYCICPSAHSAGAYTATATLLVMVNVVKGVGVHPPTRTSLG